MELKASNARHKPASLWIGNRLSFLELLCLKSFAELGQPVTLFSYGTIENLPDYVIHADARDIFDPPEILRQLAGRKHLLGSPAIHADIFRIKLLKNTDFFWVDTDAYALRPMKSDDGYLFARMRNYYPNGVLGLPKDSPTLSALDDFVSSGGRFPPWWDDQQREAYVETGNPLDFRYMPWGTLGPRALAHFLIQEDEARNAWPGDTLYPIRAREISAILTQARIPLPGNAVSLHLYASQIRATLKREFAGRPAKRSFLSALCKSHGIDPEAAPLN